MSDLKAVFALSDYSPSAQAAPSSGPQPTGTSRAYDPDGFTPRPTTAPKQSLLKRKQNEICGYFDNSSDDANAFSCSTGDSCYYNSGLDWWGCCSDSNECTSFEYTDCYNYTNRYSCTGTCTTEARVCSSASPSCMAAVFHGTNCEDTVEYTNFVCYTEATTLHIYPSVDSYCGGSGATAIASSVYSTFSPSKSTAISSSSTIGLQNQATVTYTPSHTPSPAPSHTGAIAGGVVGGIAGLAILAGTGVFCMKRRKRRQRERAVPEMTTY